MKVVLTGTSAYGPAKEDSDIDIVVTHKTAMEIWGCVGAWALYAYQTEAQEAYEPFGGFYFDLGPLKINVIDAGDEENQEKWAEATEKMKALPPIEDRAERVRTFRSFFGLGDPTEEGQL